MEPPPDRGPLLTPQQVAEMVSMNASWCRRHVPHKVTLGHSTVRWYEQDVRAWLESLRDDPCVT